MSDAPLAALRAEIAAHALDGLVVPRYDEHLGEYCAPHDERLAFLTGFTGSAGLCLVLADRAVIFVDGRYQVQVRHQVDPEAYEIEHLEQAPIDNWLKTKGAEGLRIGVNPMLVPAELYGRIAAALAHIKGQLVPLQDDLIDRIWTDQPDRPLGAIANFPLQHSGEASSGKRLRVAGELQASGADLLIEAQPDNIAWLLNVRGSDVAYNPFPQSFLLLDRKGEAEWFVDRRKLPNNLDDYDLDGVTLAEPASFLDRITARAPGLAVIVDPELAPVATALAVAAAGGTVISRASPVTLAKALKNATELAGFRSSHLEDGAAWTSLMGWLKAHVTEREASGNPITEMEVEDRVLAFRQRGAGFVYPSFHSISAAGTNAAMCHYFATPASNAALSGRDLYLLDSGGQYHGGTTDGTRTLAFGPVSDEVRRNYTAVLKCFVSLATLKFPVGTFGHQIDAFARRPLWDLGFDYDHGAGHGVGHFLSVHEQPHRFEQRANPYPLVAGLVMTIEPGLYLEGRFGMRIENQVEIVDAGSGFLRFESLTQAPIDLTPVDASLLTKDEIAFIDGYHQQVRARLLAKVDPAYRDYLLAATEPLARQLA